MNRKGLVVALTLGGLLLMPVLAFGNPTTPDTAATHDTDSLEVRYRKLNQHLRKFADEARQERKLARAMARARRQARLAAVNTSDAKAKAEPSRSTKPEPLPSAPSPGRDPKSSLQPPPSAPELPLLPPPRHLRTSIARVDSEIEADFDPLFGL